MEPKKGTRIAILHKNKPCEIITVIKVYNTAKGQKVRCKGPDSGIFQILVSVMESCGCYQIIP